MTLNKNKSTIDAHSSANSPINRCYIFYEVTTRRNKTISGPIQSTVAHGRWNAWRISLHWCNQRS